LTSTYFILPIYKITTHKMISFDDVLLFTIKSKMLKITRITLKENSFEIYLSHSYAIARLIPLVFVHSHPYFLEECITQAVWLPRHHSRSAFLNPNHSATRFFKPNHPATRFLPLPIIFELNFNSLVAS